jgi:hypothetical protein
VFASRKFTDGVVVTLMSSNCTSSAIELSSEVEMAVVANAVVVSIWSEFNCLMIHLAIFANA